MQNLIEFHQFVHKILSGNEILTITKGHKCVVNLRKLTHNLDLVKVNAYAKFDKIPSICSLDIERKKKILMLTKGNNFVVNLPKCTSNYPYSTWLRSMHMQNLIKFHGLVYKILSLNIILTLT